MHNLTKPLYGVLILFLVPLFVLAYQNPGKPTGYVNDFAGMLTPDQKQSLEVKLSNFEKETSNELSVVTIPNLGGDTIENFAVKLFQDWGIGKKGKDNGILLLIARDDRKMRIEVGYGLEGALTDAQSYWIIQNALRPAFQAGNYFAGIDGAVDNMIAITKGEFRPDTHSNSSGSYDLHFVFVIIWIFWVFFVWTGSILARSKSWWGGGIVGGALAIIFGIFTTLLLAGFAALVLVPLGLWFDYVVSRRYTQSKETGQPMPWWIGGRRGGGSGGGGFGGFGEGGSGGGGSSGSW